MAPEAVTRITESLFAQVAAGAAASPRQRKNHNLHQESDLVQRFLNVLQPGTYVRPHRHRREQSGAGFECFVMLQGCVGLLVLKMPHAGWLAAGCPVCLLATGWLLASLYGCLACWLVALWCSKRYMKAGLLLAACFHR